MRSTHSLVSRCKRTLSLSRECQLLLLAVAVAMPPSFFHDRNVFVVHAVNVKPTCIPNSLRVPEKVTHRSHKLIVAHRGASYHLPEHSIAAYRLALELGADWIEPDIIATRDRQLIAMHTVDLGVTTNVADIFPEDRRWFSPWANASSYWAFNFTYDEISRLRLRQRLPQARTTALDNMLVVPHLNDILDTLVQWNEVDLAQILRQSTTTNTSSISEYNSSKTSKYPTALNLKQSGLYIELKDAAWIQAEADLDLVDLLYEHFREEQDRWDNILRCWNGIRFDQYIVPGLVIQSFDGDVLRAFHNRWSSVFNDTAGTSKAEPNYVLLASEGQCADEMFWLNVGDHYRSFIHGIGLEKSCLLDSRFFAEELSPVVRAEEFNLALHPWTSRPEISEVNIQFNSAFEETQYLFCKEGVHGIFSESVASAVLAARLGCNNNDGAWQPPPVPSPTAIPKSDNLCYNDPSDSIFYVGVACFVVGGIVAALLFFAALRSFPSRRAGSGRRAIPTTEDTLYDLELT
jgi:glycerophosphoryl diester phosphodiesterase